MFCPSSGYLLTLDPKQQVAICTVSGFKRELSGATSQPAGNSASAFAAVSRSQRKVTCGSFHTCRALTSEAGGNNRYGGARCLGHTACTAWPHLLACEADAQAANSMLPPPSLSTHTVPPSVLPWRAPQHRHALQHARATAQVWPSTCAQDYRRRYNLEPLVRSTDDQELHKGRKRATVRGRGRRSVS